MIIIADSGSTKCDWVVINKEGNEVLRSRTIGLSPYFVTSEQIEKELAKNFELLQISSKITHVFFYGAGCSSNELKNIIRKGIKPIFPTAEVNIEHDLLGAAYAAYNGKPSIVCILGTGSNSCYFDGKKLREETPSLSYVLGDEGGGVDLGKRLIKSYFLKQMPQKLSDAFKERYDLTVADVNKSINMKPRPNTYLASYNRFILDHKNEVFIQKLIYDSLKSFFTNHITAYAEAPKSELNFIGSIAQYYKDILETVAAEFRLKVANIIHRPIDNLVQYHIKYVLPKLNE